MQFSTHLQATAPIMEQIGRSDLAIQMTSMAETIHSAIQTYAIVDDPVYGSVYAYEIDGYSSRNMMDDANIPSLLSSPVYGYLNTSDAIYQNTRAKVLSTDNPYWMHGPVISAVGGPHDGPGQAWPMASIVRILTSNNDTEIYTTLKDIVSSTDGLGLIHESINTFNESHWAREWFSWANGLFGQMILNLNQTRPEILKESYQ